MVWMGTWSVPGPLSPGAVSQHINNSVSSSDMNTYMLSTRVQFLVLIDWSIGRPFSSAMVRWNSARCAISSSAADRALTANRW